MKDKDAHSIAIAPAATSASIPPAALTFEPLLEVELELAAEEVPEALVVVADAADSAVVEAAEAEVEEARDWVEDVAPYTEALLQFSSFCC